MPGPVAPMLAVAGRMPADATGWSFEVKWDGMRALVHCPGDGTGVVRTRTLRDVTALWPELDALATALGTTACVLDGELVTLDATGRPSFEMLQPRMQASPAAAQALARLRPATFVAFDLLWIDGEDLRPAPYAFRRDRLRRLGLEGPNWLTSPQLETEDTAELEVAVRALGLEGVVAKRSSSPYRTGLRSPDWRKVKFLLAQEFVVAGWVEGGGGRRGGLGSLVLAVNTGRGDLVYCGRVGTGLTGAERERLASALGALATDASPLAGDGPRVAGLHWVSPAIVVEVAFTEWTSAGVLRHPSYRGRRLDKDPSEVTRET